MKPTIIANGSKLTKAKNFPNKSPAKKKKKLNKLNFKYKYIYVIINI